MRITLLTLIGVFLVGIGYNVTYKLDLRGKLFGPRWWLGMLITASGFIILQQAVR